jgi:hypothetical protein
MSSITFTDYVTPVPASWLNDVNTITYTTVPGLASSLGSLTTTVGGILSDYVSKAGTNNFLGTNNFFSLPTSTSIPSGDYHLTNKTYVDDHIATVVAATRRVAQVQTYTTGTSATGTTIIPFDNTIPQNTEGDQYMSVTITPTSTTSTLEVTVVLFGSFSVSSTITAALFRDSTAAAVAAGGEHKTTPTGLAQITFNYQVVAGSTSATTFKVRAGGQLAGTFTFNGASGVQYLGGVMASSITVKEYLP